MTKLSKARQYDIIDMYYNSTTYSLNEAYKGRYSREKEEAEKKILEEMKKAGGKNYKVLSHNTYNFSCAYEYYDEFKCSLHLVYYTHKNRYDIIVSE